MIFNASITSKFEHLNISRMYLQINQMINMLNVSNPGRYNQKF